MSADASTSSRPAAATTKERPRRGRAARPLWTLRVLFDGGSVVSQGPRPLPPDELVLGRTLLEDWGHAVDPLLSRRHLALSQQGGRLLAKDLGSRNGSMLNGHALHGVRELSSGDLLRLGDTFLVVRVVSSSLRPVPARGALSGLQGDSPAMHRLRGELARVGAEEASVLLRGESGTGKGVSAAALHALSGRGGPFVAVNCAAIPEQLAESSLFGHVRGAFTGAERPHCGFFQEASGGTLFLDEVGDLPAALQPKLLHAVEEGHITPVGSARPVPVSLRIVAATSLDLDRLVAEGRFRGELLARLAEFVVDLPPLRERVEDLLPLFDARAARPLHPDLVERLLLHPWPYNVRELQKVAGEAALRADPRALLGPDLVARRLPPAAEPAGPGPVPQAGPREPGPPGVETVMEALRASRGLVSDAARRLGRSRRQLYRDLARLGLDPGAFRTEG